MGLEALIAERVKRKAFILVSAFVAFIKMLGYLAEETFQKIFQLEKLLSGGGMIIGSKL